MSVRFLSGVNIDSNTLFVDDANNRVGIGTGSPVSPLDVNGIISSRGIFIAQNSGTYNVLYNASNSVSMYLGGSADPGNYYDNTTHYFRSSGAGTTYAVINYLGNVGIGTTSPAEILHLFREVHSGDVQLRVENNGYLAGTKSTLLLKSKGTNGNPVDASISNVQEGTTAGALAFYTGGANERLRIASTGNVGIGTTSPSNKLHVVGSASADAANIRIDSTNEYGGLYVTENGTFRTFLGYGNAGTIFSNAQTDSTALRGANYLHLGASSAATITINGGNDYVGIGTTSPSQKLEVAGALVVGMTVPAPFWNAQFKDFSDGSGIYISSVNGGGGKYIAGNAYYYNSLLWRSDKTVASAINLDNGTVVFYTNSGLTPNVDYSPTERMRITAAGNVGIGTTSPAEILELSTTTDPKIRFVDVGNTDAKIGIVGSTALGFEVNGSERMRIASTGATRLNAYGSGSFTGTPAYNLGVDSSGNVIELPGGVVDGSGTANYVSKWSDANTLTDSQLFDNGTNVGIGTTSPAAKLQVGNGTSNSPSSVAVLSADGGNAVLNALSLVNSRSAANGNGTSINFHNANNYGPTGRITSVQDSGTNASLRFSVYNSTDDALVERITLLSSGNVGIGTTNPLSLLHVYGSNPRNLIQDAGAGYPYIQLNNSSGNFYISIDNSSGSGFGAAYGRYLYSEGAYPMIFTTDSAERLRITGAGNVGIGTTSTFGRLQISGTVGNPDLSSATATGVSLVISNNDTGYGTMFATYGNGNGALQQRRTNTNTYYDFLLQPHGGNVGIGTTAPGAKLQVGSLDAASELIRLSNSYDTGRSARGGINWHDTTNTTGRIYTEYDGTMVSMVFGSLYNSGYNSNNLMIIRGNGNVGIGTTAPQDKLTVKGATNYNLNLGLLGGYSGIYVYNDASSAYNHLRIDASPLLLNSYSGSNVAIAAGSAVTRLTIGAYSGARLPYINGTANTFDANGITVTSSNTANAAIGGGIDLTNNVHSVGSFSPLISFSALSQSGTYNNNYAAIYGILAGDSGDGNWNSGHLVFATALAYGASEKMRITNAGNVGIGTTSPANKLVAVADATFNGENSYAIAAASSTDVAYKTVVGYDYANDVGVISAVRTGIGWKNLSILPVGNTNLGVGTLSPSQRLHVSGNIRVTGAYYDSNNSAGSSGQVLSSTGSGTDWVSLSEITGVDGTGTANYIAKWSDTDTITNSSITDNGSTVTANVDRLNMNKQAGIYTFSKTLGATVASDFFSISNSHGAQAFRVTFVCSSSGYSVAKTYEVVHAYGQTPIYFKVVDTGPYGSEDFDVAFTDSNSSTGVKATVTNNSATTAANIVATVFLGGGFETITVTAL